MWFVPFINGFEMSITLMELRPKGDVFISPSKGTLKKPAFFEFAGL